MVKWEYKLVSQVRSSTQDAVSLVLNRHGKEGWELCGIDYGCFIFKRAVDPVSGTSADWDMRP
jgi:hypothetical protein